MEQHGHWTGHNHDWPSITICSSVSPCPLTRRRRCTEDSEDWGCLEPAPGPSQRIGPGHQPPHTSAYNLDKLALYLFKISRNFIFIYDLWQESFRKYIRERKNINKYMCLLALLSKQKRELSLGVKSIATNLVDIIVLGFWGFFYSLVLFSLLYSIQNIQLWICFLYIHASLKLTKIVFPTRASCHRTLLMCSSDKFSKLNQ